MFSIKYRGLSPVEIQAQAPIADRFAPDSERTMQRLCTRTALSRTERAGANGAGRMLNRRFHSLFIPGAQIAGPKSLDQIVRVGLLEHETPLSVMQIWLDYHKFKINNIADVLDASKYVLLRDRSRQCPMFVLPVFKNVGFLTLLLQFQADCTLITSLRDYQTQASNAPPYLSLFHYPELIKSKGLVLMRGEVNSKHISREEAVDFVRWIYKFYLTDELFYKFVEAFNKTPNLFNFNDLLNAIMAIKPPKYEEPTYMPKFKS